MIKVWDLIHKLSRRQMLQAFEDLGLEPSASAHSDRGLLAYELYSHCMNDMRCLQHVEPMVREANQRRMEKVKRVAAQAVAA